MHFFNTGFFWFFEGILACLVIIGFKTWTHDRGIPMPLWKWPFLIGWLVFFGFSIAFVGTSLGENETEAALIGAIIFGLIAVISAAALWRLLLIGAEPKKSDRADEKI